MKIFENLENELWKVIIEFPDYSVSNIGRIKSLKFGKEKILKQCKDGKGYFCINLYKNGKCKLRKIHILLYETFNNYKLKNNECIHHKDENKENNNFDNFKLMTKSKHRYYHMKYDNNLRSMLGKHHTNNTKNIISKTMKEKFKNKELNLKGENHPRHKLTEEQVIQIKLLLKEGILTQQEIADMFCVSQMTISYIKRGKHWNHIKI